MPARKKFLKSAGAEFAATADALRRFSLLHPDRHFRLLRARAVALDLPPVADLVGATRAGARPGDRRGHASALRTPRGHADRGAVSAAGVSLGAARRMFLFVNGRFVQDKTAFPRGDGGLSNLPPQRTLPGRGAVPRSARRRGRRERAPGEAGSAVRRPSSRPTLHHRSGARNVAWPREPARALGSHGAGSRAQPDRSSASHRLGDAVGNIGNVGRGARRRGFAARLRRDGCRAGVARGCQPAGARARRRGRRPGGRPSARRLHRLRARGRGAARRSARRPRARALRASHAAAISTAPWRVSLCSCR